MKTYEVTYTGLFNDKVTKIMKAPSKTILRQMFKGEMTPCCKILSIKEIK